MKGIFKKNQVIITSLALMLAVAGFLQMSEDTMVRAGNASGDMAVGGTVENHYEITAGDFSELSSEISDEDMMGEALAAAENDAVKQASATAEGTVSVADGSKVMEEPGEAVLVSTVIRGDYAVNAKLYREQTRAKNKEVLMNILGDESISETQKQEIGRAHV